MEDKYNNIPTFILKDLPKKDRDQYFKFLLENDVQFVEDEDGYFVAVIRVLNPKVSELKPEKSSKSPSRAMKSTYSFQQKTVKTESPRKNKRKSVSFT